MSQQSNRRPTKNPQHHRRQPLQQPQQHPQPQYHTLHRAYSWGPSSPYQRGPGAPAPLIIHGHDVLSGRGVNISQHPGNERFRALVTSRADDDFCVEYTTSEKRAVACEIIAHIRNLDPPGRFLKRIRGNRAPRGGGSSTPQRGLEGIWEELTPAEVLKKTCQALRDCNRQDRTGYASAVTMPSDVQENLQRRTKSGLTNKQQAQHAAAIAKQQAGEVADLKQQSLSSSGSTPVTRTATPTNTSTATSMLMPHVALSSSNVALAAAAAAASSGAISPSIESAAQWLKKQRTELQICTDLSLNQSHNEGGTPTTAATTGRSSFAHHPGDLMTAAALCEGSFDDTPPSSHQHAQVGMQMMPSSPGPDPAFSYSPLYPNEEDEGTSATAAAVSSFQVRLPSLEDSTRDGGLTTSNSGVTAVSIGSGDFKPPPLPLSGFRPAPLPHPAHHHLYHDSLDPLHLAAAAVAAMDDNITRHHHHGVVLDHHIHHHHLHQYPLDQEEDEDVDTALQYSPVPTSPFRDGDFTTEEEEDRPPPYPGDD